LKVLKTSWVYCRLIFGRESHAGDQNQHPRRPDESSKLVRRYKKVPVAEADGTGSQDGVSWQVVTFELPSI